MSSLAAGAGYVETGATNTVLYYTNNNTEVLNYTFDYCKQFVEPSGLKCPMEKGNFDFTTNWLIPNDYGSEPKYTDTFYEKVTGT